MNFAKFLKISWKLPILFVLLSFASAGVTAVMSYNDARTALVEHGENRLQMVIDARSDRLGAWFSTIESDVAIFAQDPGVENAIQRFTEAFAGIEGDKTAILQDQYIHKNPNPIGQKDMLVAAPQETLYNSIHGEFHPFFHKLLKDRDYYDIFLFDTEGNLIYSVYKELDYATNLKTGQWAGTDLGAIFRDAMNAPSSDKVSFRDFAPYAPSNDAPASFAAAPVFDTGGNRIGAIAFQMPVARLNEIMNTTSGLGATGDAVFVGPDNLMRSNSRFSEGNDILETRLDGAAVSAALKGDNGIMVIDGPEGNKKITAYKPFDFFGSNWALIVNQDEAEILETTADMLAQLFMEMLVTLLIIAGIGLFIARSITSPLVKVGHAMQDVAGGDYNREIYGVKRGDEIGDIAQGLSSLQKSLSEAKAARAEADEHKARMEAEQARVVEALSIGMSELSSGNLDARIRDDFAEEYEKLKADFNEAMETMQDAMCAVVMNATGISRSSTEVSRAADDLSRRTESQAATLEETAAALEELTASVKSASEGAQKADEYVSTARESAEQSGVVVRDTVDAMGKIEASSNQISQIIGVIDDIAFQTNLLALNAGVEAARAGDAGRGFAVVASEVRALAQRSSDAAKEIKQLISASSDHVERGVTLVGNTGTALNEIVEMVASISSLVTEINAASTEQATGLAEINSAVTQLDQVTQQNAAMVEESTAASHEMTRDAEELNRLVGRFNTGGRDGAGASGAGGAGKTSFAAPEERRASPPILSPVVSGSNALKIEPASAIDDWEDF